MFWVVAGRGGLGNQMFQHAAATFFGRERGVLVGLRMHRFYRAFPAAWGVAGTAPGLALDRLDNLVGHPPRFGGRRSMARVTHSEGLDRVVTISNRVGWISGYFQDPQFVSGEYLARLRASKRARSAVDTLLNDSGTRGPLVFVHLRLGDYLSWPKRNMNAALPLEWSHKRLLELLNAFQGATAVVLSNDPFAARSFANRMASPTLIAPADETLTLELMTRCEAGVLAASSYSWWGARLALSRGAPGPFVAPRFWTGFRSGTWLQPSMRASPFTFVPVSESDLSG